jgi:hypothetical protein
VRDGRSEAGRGGLSGTGRLEAMLAGEGVRWTGQEPEPEAAVTGGATGERKDEEPVGACREALLAGGQTRCCAGGRPGCSRSL